LRRQRCVVLGSPPGARRPTSSEVRGERLTTRHRASDFQRPLGAS
jgi:hypothetical protein